MLAQRWGRDDKFRKLKRDYQFVAESTALKIAFPQDDYDCHVLLDEWMIEWNADVVFSVISSNLETLYPQFSRKGSIGWPIRDIWMINSFVSLLRLFTRGPLTPATKEEAGFGPYFGKLGETKWKIGLEVLEKIKGLDLKGRHQDRRSTPNLGPRKMTGIGSSTTANSRSAQTADQASLTRMDRSEKRSKSTLGRIPSAPFAEVEIRRAFPGWTGRNRLPRFHQGSWKRPFSIVAKYWSRENTVTFFSLGSTTYRLSPTHPTSIKFMRQWRKKMR